MKITALFSERCHISQQFSVLARLDLGHTMKLNTSLPIILATIISMLMMLSTVQGVREAGCTCDYNLDYVCGEDGKTYDNVCYAGCQNITIQTMGQC